MTTPFDDAIRAIAEARYHNHRTETHSDVVSDGFLNDLRARCPEIRADLATGSIRAWRNVASPGDRQRLVDLLIGEPNADGRPDLTKVRIALENKSVITAHRNRTNRFDDLAKGMKAVNDLRPEAILVATVLVGLAQRVLNVPDRVRVMFPGDESAFNAQILPRLSSGDTKLFDEFPKAISSNLRGDAEKTVKQFRDLPTRGPAQTHLVAYDSVLIVPVMIDNVHAPHIPRPNALGIDVDREYQECIERTCRAYSARFHG